MPPHAVHGSTRPIPFAAEKHRTYSTRFPAPRIPVSEGATGSTGETRRHGLGQRPDRRFATVWFGASGACCEGPSNPSYFTLPDSVPQAKPLGSVNQKKEVYEEVAFAPCAAVCWRTRRPDMKLLSMFQNREGVLTSRKVGTDSLGDFTYLKGGEGSRYGVKNGDVVKATIVGGNVIAVSPRAFRCFKSATIPIKNGSPGMGLYIHEATHGNDGYGFTSL